MSQDSPLTATQVSYLRETRVRNLKRGWGGYSSTRVVRHLEELGLVRLREFPGGWEATITNRGRDALDDLDGRGDPSAAAARRYDDRKPQVNDIMFPLDCGARRIVAIEDDCAMDLDGALGGIGGSRIRLDRLVYQGGDTWREQEK